MADVQTTDINTKPAVTAIDSNDQIFISDGGTALKKISYTNLAKAIIEQYNASQLAGATKTIQTAFNELNSNKAELENLSRGADTVGSLDDVKAAFVARANASSARTVSFFALHFSSSNVAEFPGGGEWICKLTKGTGIYWCVECTYASGYNANAIYPVFVKYENGAWTFKNLTTDINNLNSKFGRALGNNPNFDNIVEPGFYYFGDTTDAVNPPNKDAGYLNMLVLRVGDMVTQVVFGGRQLSQGGRDKIWVRYRNGNSDSYWNRWIAYATQSEVDALNSKMVQSMARKNFSIKAVVEDKGFNCFITNGMWYKRNQVLIFVSISSNGEYLNHQMIVGNPTECPYTVSASMSGRYPVVSFEYTGNYPGGQIWYVSDLTGIGLTLS